MSHTPKLGIQVFQELKGERGVSAQPDHWPIRKQRFDRLERVTGRMPERAL